MWHKILSAIHTYPVRSEANKSMQRGVKTRAYAPQLLLKWMVRGLTLRNKRDRELSDLSISCPSYVLAQLRLDDIYVLSN